MWKAKKRGRCPVCLPDSDGAIFTNCGEFWECNNCHHQIVRKVYSPKPKLSPSQERMIEKVKSFGWNLDSQKFIGRGAWVTFKRDLGNDSSNLVYGDCVYGLIGVRGQCELTLCRFGGDAKITDDIGMSVYLRNPTEKG